MPDPLPKQPWLTTLGWAAYLACSWTWCIGMFLPVLLVRDFGIWGFVVFAVPNVIGAGGMGWVLRKPMMAEAIRNSHFTAVRAFSQVTIAFQWFFLAWLIASNLHANRVVYLAPLIFLATVLPVVLLLGKGRDRTLVLTAATLFFSSVIAAVLLIRGDLSLPPLGPRPFSHELVYLAPVCLFGFMLCPYLDASFLLARQEQRSGPAVVSFAFGFVGLFLPMILFTLLYATQFRGSGQPNQFVGPTSLAALFVAAHMFGQVSVTGHVHSTKSCPTGGDESAKQAVFSLFAGFALIGVVAFLDLTGERTYAGLSVGELLYRAFMSFYGLAFPAYVWLCIIPLRGEQGIQAPSRIKLSVLAVAVALAAPCFWMGFIERQTWWLAPGLGVVLIARPVLAAITGRRRRGGVR